MHGHDYRVPGTYEVTIVVAGRKPVFGEIVGTTKGGGEKPHLKPSPLGQIVLDNEIPKIHHYYPEIDVWQVCLMPDHLHMIVRISQPLPKGKHLGIVIGAFKGGVSRAWWNLDATVSVVSASEHRLPLFEPNYNDHILMRDGQLDNWKRYLRDNPLRYMMQREYPNLFQRALCITIGGTRYSVFGNMLLFRRLGTEGHLADMQTLAVGHLKQANPERVFKQNGQRTGGHSVFMDYSMTKLRG